jgi:hypothetical protein
VQKPIHRLLFVMILSLLPGIIAAQPQAPPSPSAYKAAWRLFIKLNRFTPHPASQNQSLYWETWADSDDIFDNPKVKPDWQKLKKREFSLTPLRQEIIAHQNQVEIQHVLDKNTPCTYHRGQEVRMNEDTVDYIAANGLYNVEGQVAAAGKIDFPPGSIEVKAFWDIISEGDKPTFYWRTCNGTIYGLTAIHISSKIIPNWFWATFEHIPFDRNTPQECAFIKCVDPFGAYPPVQMATRPTKELGDLFAKNGMKDDFQRLWQHYRLVGVQTGFMAPRLLGNSVLEGKLGPTSSCITCHSRSTISRDHTRLSQGPSENASYNGPPNPCWLVDQNGKQIFRQLDFVWSLLEAKSINTGQSSFPSSLNCGTP